MTFEEFLKKIYDNTRNDMWLAESFTDPSAHTNDLYFKVYWSLGGTWANCYGDTKACDPESEPELDSLDQILEIVAPNLSFLAYKNIVRKVVEYRETSHGDYYGGYTNKAFKGFSVRRLYDKLNERGLI